MAQPEQIEIGPIIERLVNNAVESPRSPDLAQYDLTGLSFMGITGESGTGKTTLARRLSELFGMGIFKSGTLLRQLMMETTGSEIVGFAPRDPLIVDRAFDNIGAKVITNSSQNPAIVEARLVGFITAEEKAKAKEKKLQFPKGIIVLLTTTDERRRAERVARRHPDEDVDTVITQSRERMRGDLALWRQIHPLLNNVENPFDPNIEIDGRKIYDIVVNTDYLSAEEVIAEVLKQLAERGFIKRKPLPQEGIIFEA